MTHDDFQLWTTFAAAVLPEVYRAVRDDVQSIIRAAINEAGTKLKLEDLTEMLESPEMEHLETQLLDRIGNKTCEVATAVLAEALKRRPAANAGAGEGELP
jgi:hypothetical protein